MPPSCLSFLCSLVVPSLPPCVGSSFIHINDQTCSSLHPPDFFTALSNFCGFFPPVYEFPPSSKGPLLPHTGSFPLLVFAFPWCLTFVDVGLPPPLLIFFRSIPLFFVLFFLLFRPSYGQRKQSYHLFAQRFSPTGPCPFMLILQSPFPVIRAFGVGPPYVTPGPFPF